MVSLNIHWYIWMIQFTSHECALVVGVDPSNMRYSAVLSLLRYSNCMGFNRICYALEKDNEWEMNWYWNYSNNQLMIAFDVAVMTINTAGMFSREFSLFESSECTMPFQFIPPAVMRWHWSVCSIETASPIFGIRTSDRMSQLSDALLAYSHTRVSLLFIERVCVILSARECVRVCFSGWLVLRWAVRTLARAARSA